MIPERVQHLFREAVLKTCIQGRRSMSEHGGCAYLAPNGDSCLVGHALPPALLAEVGSNTSHVRAMADEVPEVGKWLGTAGEGYFGAVNTLWSQGQKCHDLDVDYPDADPEYRRPFGVSWSAWFWYRARTLAKASGFDIGNYPRHEVRDAQAA